VLVIESEDYNFSGGFIDNPLPIAEGGGPQSDSYANQTGVQDIDFNDTRTAPRSQEAPWRTRMRCAWSGRWMWPDRST